MTLSPLDLRCLGQLDISRLKPRLRLRHGIWSCFSTHGHGFGYTAKQAYDDWKRHHRVGRFG